MTAEKKVGKVKNIQEGVVVSNKMDKSIVVEVTRIVKHVRFKKIIRRKRKFVAHDAKNVAKQGDRVSISETRPMSKNKRWQLEKVLS